MKKIPVRKSVAPANGSSSASHGRRRLGLATMAAPSGRSRADEVSGSDSFGVDVEEPLDEPIVAAVDHDDFDDQDEVDEVGAAGYPDAPEQFGEDSSDHTTGLDDHIDDPVRMYLMQMGEIPLLIAGRGNRLGQGDRTHSHAASATACWPATICCKGPCRC